jgi:hypothetical protein
MKGNFDMLGFYVIPQDVFGGIRKKAMEDSFAVWTCSLPEREPGGRTQTQQPNVCKAVKSGLMLV